MLQPCPAITAPQIPPDLSRHNARVYCAMRGMGLVSPHCSARITTTTPSCTRRASMRCAALSVWCLPPPVLSRVASRPRPSSEAFMLLPQAATATSRALALGPSLAHFLPKLEKSILRAILGGAPAAGAADADAPHAWGAAACMSLCSAGPPASQRRSPLHALPPSVTVSRTGKSQPNHPACARAPS